MNEVYGFLNTLKIKKNMPIVVAVSYGSDSMFLLHLLKNKYPDNKIICAHVHHNHRKESDNEAKLLGKYCKINKIYFEFMKIDKYKNNNFTEEEAREKRYTFFDSVMNKYNSKYLFTAHHADDLMETILMRLVRGSNIKGYAGIVLKSKRKDYYIIRPLLYITKDKIEKYCNKNNIPYAVDKSNNSNLYTRNRYRNNVLKFLKKENKNVHRKFLSFSNQLQEYETYIDKIVLKYYKKIVEDGIIDVAEIKKQEGLIRKKIIEKYLLDEYKDEIKSIDNRHVLLVMDLINSNKTNDKISMPNKKVLIKSYNKIYFDNDSKYNSYRYLFEDYLLLPNKYSIKKVDKLSGTSNFVCVLNSSDISLPLYVRNKMNGDKMDVLGLNGSKKIKDIFINEKVDVCKRKNYPILVDSEDRILWLPGLKKSKYDKSKTGKYDIILEYFKEERTNAK